MKNKFLNGLFWVLADALLIFALAFLPSFFSLFCFLAALIIVPMDRFKKKLRIFFESPVKPIVLAILIALIVVLFPLSELINGINKVIKDSTPSDTPSIIYSKESRSDPVSSENPKSSSSENVSHTYNNTSSKISSSKVSSSSPPTSSSQPTSSETEISISEEGVVYRTPAGKRYHFSPECGGKNSYDVTLDEAISDGLTPCKKCAE